MSKRTQKNKTQHLSGAAVYAAKVQKLLFGRLVNYGLLYSCSEIDENKFVLMSCTTY